MQVLAHCSTLCLWQIMWDDKLQSWGSVMGVKGGEDVEKQARRNMYSHNVPILISNSIITSIYYHQLSHSRREEI